MIAEGQTFVRKRIYLDGCSFVRCRFEKCTIVYSGVLGMEIKEPEFIDCNWELQGAARETLNFLGAIYKGGARELVENTFRTICGEPPDTGTGTLN